MVKEWNKTECQTGLWIIYTSGNFVFFLILKTNYFAEKKINYRLISSFFFRPACCWYSFVFCQANFGKKKFNEEIFKNWFWGKYEKKKQKIFPVKQNYLYKFSCYKS